MSPPDLHQVCPGLWIWHGYDPSIKTETFSTAILGGAGLYFVDPIPLSTGQIEELSGVAAVAGVVVTNANHQRAACEYSDRFSVPIFAHPAAFIDSRPARLQEVVSASEVAGDLEVIEIEGAAAGEIALYRSAARGTLIVGDALINFEPYGFTFLPRKYCQNEKQMRRSLHELVARPAERIIFAHGMPILSGATERLRQLLESP